MSQLQETTYFEKLPHSKSSSCLGAPVQTAFQAKYDLSCCGIQHIKKVISDRYIEEKRYMSPSPTPRKHARVELDIHDDDHEKKEGGEDRMGHATFTIDVTDEVVHIKSEPPDDVENEQIKSEPLSYEQSFSRVRSNSLHCTSISRKSNTDSAKFNSTCASFLAYPCRGRPKHSVTSDSPSTSTSSLEVNNALNDQPDSSTGTCEQLMRGGRRRHSISCVKPSSDQTSAHLPVTTSTSSGEAVLCQVCGDIAAGFYCDAYICEACKKFFIRASKLERPRYVCLRQKSCVITKESRVHCQYCRFQKCLQLNMHYSKDGQKNASKVGVQEIPCRVCSAPSSGFHFGALTCEGCKGFFRRMVKEREAYSYKCNRNGNCDVNAMTRNMCKACRYTKCLHIGMSVDGSRIGRQPNAVKHAISLEAKKQAALKTETESSNVGNSSPTNFSFDSVILDPCFPGEIDDSLQSVDVNQNPVSVDALASPCGKAEEVKCEQELSAPSCQDNSVSQVVGHQVSSQSPVDVFRIPRQNLLFSSDHRGHHQSSQSVNLNCSPMSLSISRSASTDNFRRACAETLSSLDSQPEDLTIDLSIPRTTATSTGHFTSHPTLPSTRCNNLSSPSTNHYSPNPTPSYEGSHLLSTPLPNPPSSPCYSPTDYNPHHSQFHHSFFHGSSLDQEEHHVPVYQHRRNYGSSSPVLNIESYSQYEDQNIAQNSQHMPQEETYLHRLSSQSSQPLAHFPSSSPVYNKQEGVVHEHHQTSHYHQHEAEFLQQPQVLLTRQNNRDDAFTLPVNQHLDNSHLDRSNIYRVPCNLQIFPEKSCQVYDSSSHQHDFNLSPHQCSHCPTDVLLQSQSYHISHFQPLSPAVTSTSCPQKEVRPSPASTPNYDLLEAPSPAPIPETIAASRDENYMNMSNEELHIVILDAAKSLSHFSVVHRAKSNSFDASRFKDVDSTWEKMMEHFHFHAKCIVRFAKRVPGFRRLKIDDQVVLLRMATYSLVILNHSRAYELDTGFYNYFNFTQKEIERISELFPEFDVIHSHYKHTGIMTQRLGFTDLEYAYMSCMLVLNDEHPGLEDVQRTRELKERYMNAFQDYELEHFSNGSHRFGQMLQRLSEFPKINMEHNIAVGLVITKNSQLHIPQLYAEMYAQNSYAQDGGDSTRSYSD